MKIIFSIKIIFTVKIIFTIKRTDWTLFISLKSSEENVKSKTNLEHEYMK